MKQLNSIFTFFFLILSFNFYGQKKENIWKGNIDLNKLSLKEYFYKLKKNSSKLDSSKLNILVISQKAPKNWIKKNDIEFLMKHIESEIPSFCIMHIFSSNLPLNEKSTLGGQVMNLIDSYRQKEEYPNFLTRCSKTEKARMDEIKKWWKENK